MNARLMLFLVGLSLLLGACDLQGESQRSVEQTYTFDSGAEEWGPIFADYSTDADTSADGMALTVAHRPLPEAVPDGHGLFLSGRNHSDDLFMGLRRRITGLSPNTTYALTIEATLASAAPSDCAGIGGPPGESVWLKGGAAPEKPTRTVDATDWYRLTVDKGGQSQGGSQVRVLGVIANGIEECHDTPFRLIDRSMDESLAVTTNADGSLWLLVGTDSGFEGTTRLYYDSIHVALEPRSE